ncbi:MAG TPA: phosphoglycolate phosphatase [Thermoanaerobaculia bacterium]|jgi:phosphoglycolate phosphatase
MNRPAALVFDLDGTLIDSRRDIRTAVNRMRADLGLAPLTLEEVVGMVGEGARVLVERALASDARALAPVALPEQVARALPAYLAYYDEVALDTTRAYDGIPQMLERLSAAFPLALLSNKGETMSRRILAALGLADRFQAILGGDSLPTRKPDPAGLRLAAERLGVATADLVLIGDTRIDAATAEAAGCGFLLVEWGFPRPPEVAGLRADLRAATPAEVADRLLGLEQRFSL